MADEQTVVTEGYVSDPNDTGRRFKMEGDVMTGVDLMWHATGDDTDGQCLIVEAVFPPGTEFLMHRHTREDEAFLVIEGQLTLRDPDAPSDHVANPGQMVWAPRDRKHTYASTGEVPARVVVVMTPGSGLDGFFREHRNTEIGDPEDIAKLAADTEEKYGVALFPEEQTVGSARGY